MAKKFSSPKELLHSEQTTPVQHIKIWFQTLSDRIVRCHPENVVLMLPLVSLADQTGFGKGPAAPHQCQDMRFCSASAGRGIVILVIRFRLKLKFDVPAYSAAIARSHAGYSKPTRR